MIKIYNKEKHGEIIRDYLEEDLEGKALIGEIGLFEPPESCSFWDYKIVIFSGNTIVGFAFFGGTSSITNSTQLKQLYVLENFRKEGYAKKLIKEGERYYKEIGIDYIKISAVSSNKSARKLYEKCGYKETGFELRNMKYKGKLAKAIFYDKKI